MKELLVLALSMPIEFGRDADGNPKEITELEIRPITGKDMMGLKFAFDTEGKSLIVDADSALKLAAKLTNIPATVLAQMTAPDVLRLSMELQTFLASGQWTGQK